MFEHVLCLFHILSISTILYFLNSCSHTDVMADSGIFPINFKGEKHGRKMTCINYNSLRPCFHVIFSFSIFLTQNWNGILKLEVKDVSSFFRSILV